MSLSHKLPIAILGSLKFLGSRKFCLGGLSTNIACAKCVRIFLSMSPQLKFKVHACHFGDTSRDIAYHKDLDAFCH